MGQDDLIEALLPRLRRAGSAILERFRADTPVTIKKDSTPVTEADLESDRILRDSLKDLTPDIDIVSEESPSFAVRGKSFWIIDPLDGTKSFIAGSPNFAVNLALVEDGEVTVGFIHHPESETTFFARVGGGAFQVGTHSEPQPISCREVPVDEPLALVSEHHPGKEHDFCQKWIKKPRFRNIGSSLKYARIASGECDLAVRLSSLHFWDIAPAIPLIREAGGIFWLAQQPDAPPSYLQPPWKMPAFLASGSMDAKRLDQLQSAILN